jgi:hypothetical protein
MHANLPLTVFLSALAAAAIPILSEHPFAHQ